MDGSRAFEEFFREEYPYVVRTLIPIVGDQPEAEAVAQDAFVKAMTRWRRIRRYDKPGAWVRRVAIRDAVRVAQRRSRDQGLAAERPSGTVVDLDAAMDLTAAICRLSPKQRAAVSLHHLGGWPAADVADVLGCSESTVRVHLHRGRNVLADLLATEQPERAG